ncbi:head maturation protease, ClpP-related [Pararhodospirillum photometricum]|uniref:ATP-dependent Clp protease proteolytic subunit n=1 Tax=Pararhodospirillum photometricum DSM 122 TaxID=1150469 RepID=H6SQN5_PARPM|nr:head maturation protease, ClpP-related [Pararhodospirillum photometricum]CCG07350.1 ATP-dependent Clp protease proteolytic subunit [Pararhodospirillum photometricum DSM 122]
MACVVNGTEIVLTGTVGRLWEEDDCFTFADVLAALAQVGRATDIRVRLNSGGGLATEGAAIHSALSMHRGAVEIVIEGWAASAASLLAMAGKTVMRPGAVMMIHDPSGCTWGTAEEHRASADALDALGDAYAQVYADKTGKPVTEMRALMKREVWLGPEEAVAQGFADRADGATNDNKPADPVAFGGWHRYAHVPKGIAAVASANKWPARALMTTPAPQTVHPQETPNMSENGTPPTPAAASATPDPLAAERDRCATIAKMCTAAGAPALADGFMAAGLSVAEVKAKLDATGEIRATCATAKRLSPSLDAQALEREFLAAGTSPEAARKALWDRLAADSTATAIVNTLTPEAAAGVAAGGGATHSHADAIARANKLAGFAG